MYSMTFWVLGNRVEKFQSSILTHNGIIFVFQDEKICFNLSVLICTWI